LFLIKNVLFFQTFAKKQTFYVPGLLSSPVGETNICAEICGEKKTSKRKRE
jgi:hypothetical protein